MEYIKTKLKTEHGSLEHDSHRADMGEDMSLAGITVVIGLASLIGLWGLTCLASGLIKSGGIIGLEMACVYSALGTDVSVVELMDPPVPS